MRGLETVVETEKCSKGTIVPTKLHMPQLIALWGEGGGGVSKPRLFLGLAASMSLWRA